MPPSPRRSPCATPPPRPTQRAPANQALQTERRDLSGGFGFAILTRGQHAKVEAPTVFYGRRAVRVQHIALIEDCFRDAVNQSGGHERTVSRTEASARSIAWSQVGMPSRTLNS